MAVTGFVAWNMVMYSFYSSYQSLRSNMKVDIHARLAQRAAAARAKKAGLKASTEPTAGPSSSSKFLSHFNPEDFFECDPKSIEKAEAKNVNVHRRSLFQEEVWTEITSDEYYLEGNDANPPRIPHIIHQSWKTDMVPESVFGGIDGDEIKNISLFIASWMKNNPEWTYMFWRDEDNMRLFETRPELAPFRDAFKMDIPGVARADFSRYAYMYLIGGVYADIDFECFLPFDDLARAFDVILSSEPVDHTVALYDMPEVACNAFMASKPGHDFWLLMMQRITEAIKKDKGALCRRDANYCTGPQRLQKVYEEYAIYNQDAEPLPMLPWHYFFNEVAEYNRGLHDQCKVLERRRKYQCKFRASKPNGEQPTFQSYGVHHWSNQWSGTIKHVVPKQMNITSLVPNGRFKRPFS
jgi:hypothetical protein